MSKRMFSHALVGLHDFVAAVCVATVLGCGFTATAHAYVDPSVMTYTIQALAGVAVALSAVAGVAFRRTRKALMKALNIDENARREKDTAWTRTTPVGASPVVHAGERAFLTAAAKAAEVARESAPANTEGAAPAQPATPSKKRRAAEAVPAAPLPWFKRFLFALLAVGFPGFTLGIVAPFEIVAGNTDSLSYSLSDVAGILAIAVFAAILIVAALLSVFRGKAFWTLAVLCITAGLGFWVQAMFLNVGMPVMNGTPIDYWGTHGTMMIVSLVVWLAIFGIAIFAFVKRPSLTQTLACGIAVVLIAVQGIGVTSLFAKSESSNLFITEDGLYDVTTGRGDVIVFVLDHFDTKFFPAVQAQFPQVLDELEGFTWYTDCSGMMVPTLYAVPYMLTGAVPTPGQNIYDYYRSRYLDSQVITDLTSTGYTLGLYTPDIQSGYFTEEEVARLFGNTTVNIHELDSLEINPIGAIKSLIRAALFRDMPWVLKSFFGFYTDALNQHVLDTTTVHTDEAGNIILSDPAKSPYIIDDVLRKTELDAYGLSVTNSVGCVKFIHYNGAHLPFTMDLHGNRVPQDSVTQTEQAAGVLALVGDYLAQMKALGAYENATIIITADHGDWRAVPERETMVTVPLMLVKQAGDTWTGLQTSGKQVSHEHMIATLVEAVGADTSMYGPTLAQAPETSTRYFYSISAIEDRVATLWEYEIVGNANDISSWHYTGNSWVVEGGTAD